MPFEKLPDSIKSTLNSKEIIAQTNSYLEVLKNNPELLEKYFNKAITTIGRSKGAFLKSSEVTNTIIKAIIKEINPNINLQSFDSKDFLFRYKGINFKDIRFKVLKIINARGINKKFFATPAELKAIGIEPDHKKKKQKSKESGHFREIGRRWKKSGGVSGAERAIGKFE